MEIVLGTISAVTTIAAIGIFEVNTVQFGMDQMIEASFAQLSSFIHWYFWSMHLGQQIVFCGAFVLAMVIPDTQLVHQTNSMQQILVNAFLALILIIWMSSLSITSYFLHNVKKMMYIAKTGINHLSKCGKCSAHGKIQLSFSDHLGTHSS